MKVLIDFVCSVLSAFLFVLFLSVYAAKLSYYLDITYVYASLHIYVHPFLCAIIEF